MAAGVIYTEIDLDSRKFDAAKNRIIYDAKTMAVKVEDAWKTLGKTSDLMFDMMRKQASNAFEKIKNDSKSSAAERVRAEEALNAKLKSLNEQQFGHQISLIDSLKKNWIAASAAIVAALMLVHKAFNMAQEGAKIIAIRDSFDLVTKAVNINGDAIIAKMKEVSSSTIDDTNLMIQSQRLLAQGFSPKEIIKLTETARVAARFMATDVKTAFDMITEAAITGNARGLRPFGITQKEITKAVEDHAAALGTTEKYLTDYGKSQAIINTIIKKGEENIKLLGGELQPSLSEKFQQLNTVINEVKETIGIGLLPVFGALSAGALQMSSWILYLAGSYAFLEATLLKLSLFEEKRKQAPEWQEISKNLFALAEDMKNAATNAALLTLNTLDNIKKEIEKRIKGINETITGVGGKTGELPSRKISTKSEIDEAALARDRLPIIQKYEKEAADARLLIFNAGQEQMKNNALIYATESGQSIVAVTREWDEKIAKEKLNYQIDILQKERDLEIEQIRKQGLLTNDLRMQIISIYNDKEKVARTKTETEIQAITLQKAKETKEMMERAALYQIEAYDRGPTDIERAETEARIAAITRQQTIETADLNKQIFELQGNWIAAREAEINFNNATLDNYLKTHTLTLEQEILLKQLNKIKNAEIEARKSMDIFTLSGIGMKKYFMQTKDELANTFENILPNSMKSFWDEFENYMKKGEFNWKNFTDSLQNIWASTMRKMLESLVNDLLAGAVGGISKLLNIGGTTSQDTGNIYGGILGLLGTAWRGITHLQEGGIVTRPTFAAIGERGPEAVIPLKHGIVSEEKKKEKDSQTVIIINANDAKSFDDMVRRNPGSITGVIQRSKRAGGMKWV